MPTPPDHDDSTIVIRTVPNPALPGRYAAVIELSDDDVVPLTPTSAREWASSVVRALAVAEHDAAVIRQVLAVEGLGGDSVAILLGELRADRPHHYQPPGVGLGIRPGVSAATGEPFLVLLRNGEPLGQLTTDGARSHAIAVLEVAEVARLDTAYHHVLRERVNLPPQTASRMVHELASSRTR